ncbi:MAG: efflux RND transporter permease subunit, partial [Pseudomonadota bacterium]
PLSPGRDGAALRVGDVAEVQKGRKDPPDTLAVSDGTRSIMVAAYLEPNLRVDLWAENARQVLSDFADAAPTGVSVDIVFDQSVYTETRLFGLARNLVFSALLVVVVLFFALGWRAALVVGSALPLTVCLVLILFNFFGMPLHQMSVTGLVISLGLLIDNAIVVVDEFQLRRQRGMAVRDALEDSIGHLAAPLFASTLTTALAFAPIALQPGGTGEFIGMMGVAVIFAVSSSLLLSLTVIPAFAAWFDRERDPDAPQRFWQTGVNLPVLTAGYRWTLKKVLAFPPLGLALGAAPAILGFVLAQGLPLQFFPPTERDQFQVEIVMPPEASIAETRRVTDRATELLEAYPGVEEVHWTI